MDQSIRKAILERDHYTCQACGRKTAGQVHHIVPIAQGGGNDLHNLVTLCGRWHMLISPIPPFALRRAFGIPKNKIGSEREKVLEAIAQFQATNAKRV